ncbi:MAG: hypothetical protein M3Q29_10075, partial [Chloroflexota bacterium]|nr:hypothetical protein [Chloroflexota bacterium]
QTASVSRSTNTRGTFTVSVSAYDPQKVASRAHNSFLTSAKASEKVGRCFSYQAARRTTLAFFLAMYRWAKRVTIENKPKKGPARFAGRPAPTNAAVSRTPSADALLGK